MDLQCQCRLCGLDRAIPGNRWHPIPKQSRQRDILRACCRLLGIYHQNDDRPNRIKKCVGHAVPCLLLRRKIQIGLLQTSFFFPPSVTILAAVLMPKATTWVFRFLLYWYIIVTVADCAGRPSRTRDLSLGRRVRYQFTKEVTSLAIHCLLNVTLLHNVH